MTTGAHQPPPAGWPPPPPNPTASPVPPRRRKPLFLAGLGALTAAALAGAGLFLALRHDDAAGRARTVWHTTGVSDSLVGLWSTDHTLVRIGHDSTVGYDPSTGSKLFSVPAPSGLKACFASPNLSPNGIGAIFYSSDGDHDCNTIAAIDAKSGRMLWHKHGNPLIYPTTGGAAVSEGDAFLDGSTIVAASDNGQVAGLTTSGSQVWGYQPTSADCIPENTGGKGAIVIVQERCVSSSGDESAKYVAVDAATGRHLWQAPARSGFYLRSVISTDPVVLLTASNNTQLENSGLTLASGTTFLAFNSAGHQTAAVAADENEQGGVRVNSPLPTAVVVGGTLYANTETAKGEDGTVTAYDLAHGGAPSWYYLPLEGGDATNTWVLGTTGDGRAPLVGEEGHVYGNPSPVHELGPGAGRITTRFILPSNVEPEDAVLNTTPDGHLVLAALEPAKDAPALSVFTAK